MKKTLLVGAAVMLSWVVSAPRTVAQTVPPALLVQGEKGSEPLGLKKLQTDVRIHGYLAETTTTMTFFNPLPRAMEGDLYFPLPEGATISGYALDIQGTMVDGVAVEKEKGRQVFEEVVRKGIDPGLIEWTKGNNFHTRVFPIPARGTRTVRVQYVTELIGGKEGTAYHLPLNFKEKIAEFSLRVEVVKPAAPPKIAQGELANFAFEKWRDSYLAETKLQDAALTKDLVVALPSVQKQQVLVEKTDDGQVYFAIHDFPAAPPAKASAEPPKRVVIYWDASGSRGGSDHKRELAILRAYFEAQRFPVSGPERKIEVDVVFFRDAAAKPKRIVLSGADAGPLVAALEKVQYDGGTQMASISPPPGATRPDFYMLFTDGLSNFGREEPRGLDAPVYIFSADPAANHPLLHHLATTTGGRYFNLGQLTDAQVVPAIGRPAFSFLSASSDAAQATGIYPELPQPVAGRFTLVGKLTAEQATITLGYGFKGSPLQNRSFKVSRSQAAEGSLLRRLWAQKKLAQLIAFPERNEKEIVALGKQFGMVTPFTSLIVLESLEQYVEHEIAPPKSLAAMREEYMGRIDTLEFQKRKQKADKIELVLKMWEGRVKWWQTEFKYPADFKYKEPPGGKEADRLMEREERGGGAPRPAARPEGPPGDMAPAREPAKAAAGGRPPAGALPSIAPASPAEARDSGQAGEKPARQPGIVIKPWDPDTPYLKDLRAAKGKGLFAIYMTSRAKYGNSPAFFLDCADFFFEANDRALALQVLSNIAELQLEDAAVLRILAYRLREAGYLDLAIQTFEQVLKIRPEEPQSYRDLALALAQRAALDSRTLITRADPAKGDIDKWVRAEVSVQDGYARAIDLLSQVVMRRWDERFAEIELIALEELNQILPRAAAVVVTKCNLDPRLIKPLDVDVRIVMTWHADATDIDLWVTEPSGEKAFYGHNRTAIGGLVSRDFTGGYGPEEYMVRRAMHGMYKIEANYYGSRAAKLLGPVTVEVDVFTHFGRSNQQRKTLTFRLKEAKETVTIGEIEF